MPDGRLPARGDFRPLIRPYAMNHWTAEPTSPACPLTSIILWVNLFETGCISIPPIWRQLNRRSEWV